MNDEWVDRLRAEPVNTDPRPGFKDELKDTVRAEWCDSNTSEQPSTAGGPRRWWMLAVAAACIVLLVGGLIAFGRNEQTLTPANVPETVPNPESVPSTNIDSPPTTQPEVTVPVDPAPADTVVSDPLTISLDDWIVPQSTPSVDEVVVEIDWQALPAGWTVSEESGQVLGRPANVFGYSYTAVVTTDDQAVFDVSFVRDPLDGDPCFLPLLEFSGTVGDLTGTTVGDAVCGGFDEDSTLAVVPTADSRPVGQRSALDVAKTLSFVRADDVPHPDLVAVVGDEEPDDVAFAGTLSGVRWALTVEASGTRRMFAYVAGVRTSGIEGVSQELRNGELSPMFMDSVLEGVPGYGAIAYGHVEGDAVAAIVTTHDRRTARLPMMPIGGRSAFAVPFPDTVDVATITFVDADGSTIGAAEVPDIPVGFKGGALNLIPRR